MRLFLLISFGLFINESVCSQTTDNAIRDIKTYVNKIDSLCSIKTWLTADKALLIPTISEGAIENKKRGLKGGFSNETVTSPDIDTVYLIKRSDNLDKYLIESYYFKNDKLVFSKIELQDGENERKTLFLRQDYFKDDKVISTTFDKNELKKKYKWRTDFDPLTNGYFYYKEFKKNRITK